MPATQDDDIEPRWVLSTQKALLDAGVRVIGHVPDGGLRHLIRRLEAHDGFSVVRLTTEEEGVALATGAWLGGARAAVLMQSSGVGNCTNMLGLWQSCAVPAVMLVTMRGQEGETNPWQVPMGRAAAANLELMGVDVRRVDDVDAVAPAVNRACRDAFDHGGGATAVLIDQQVIGVKQFVAQLGQEVSQ